MRRGTVLFTAPGAALVALGYETEPSLRALGVLTWFSAGRLNDVKLLPMVTDIGGIVRGDDRISGEVMYAAPRLRVIAKCSEAIQFVDLASA